MRDVSEILADSKIQQAIGALVFDAAREAGISLSHADGVRMSIVGRLEEGKPVDPAVALVQAIRDNKSLRSAFIEGMDKCRETKDAYGEWPSLEGRVDLANDAYPVEE